MKTAVITGCNRGVGLTLLKRFTGEGYNVIAHARRYSDEWHDQCRDLEKKNNVTIYNVYSDLEALPVAGDGIVCLLHTEVLDAININKMYALMDKVQQNRAQVLLFAKDDAIVNNLGMAAAAFTVKMALCHAPEGFISPVFFYSNDELSLPKMPMQALCERSNASGNMEINAMWLFNY